MLERIRDNMGCGTAPSRHRTAREGETDVNEEFAFFHPDSANWGGSNPAN